MKIRLVRRQDQASARRAGALLRLAITGLTLLGLSQLLPLPAAFGQAYYYGGLTASIPLFQPVRSINVNVGSITFSNCQTGDASQTTTGLARNDNGQCFAGPVTVTTAGNISSVVTLQGSNAVPDAGSPGWTLCGNNVVLDCTSGNFNFNGSTGGNLPGTDEYTLYSFVPQVITLPVCCQPNSAGVLTTQGTNDLLLGSGEPVPPGSSADESFWLIGPLVTTNTAANAMASSINWTAS